jgi:hypothetical protein
MDGKNNLTLGFNLWSAHMFSFSIYHKHIIRRYNRDSIAILTNREILLQYRVQSCEVSLLYT